MIIIFITEEMKPLKNLKNLQEKNKKAQEKASKHWVTIFFYLLIPNKNRIKKENVMIKYYTKMVYFF